ncbi:3-hydroxyisobutyrate dehydrogenase [Fonsecaea pedrosoi]|nr:3-hydroxyisobutyrate dehydrogenase [Fonsecaea pedrosoi]
MASSSSSSDPQLPANIGFIGLGNMGFPMFSNLVSKLPATSTVHFYDVNPRSIEMGLNESGAVAKLDACGSSREVAEKSDLLLSIVPEGKHVRAVFLDPENGVLAAKDLSDKILIDSSTIDTATSLEVGEQTRTRHPKAHFFDAPVSGGTAGAKRGVITFMVGCTASDPHFPLLKTLMALMGKNIYACGGPSLGLTAKLCNNYLSSSITLLNAETFNLAIKSGMDPRTLQEILKTATGGNINAQNANPVPGLTPNSPASHDYALGFRIEYTCKDMALALDACDRVGAKLCIGQAVLDAFDHASKDPRCAGLDTKVVFRYLGGDEKWQDKFPDGGK